MHLSARKIQLLLQSVLTCIYIKLDVNKVEFILMYLLLVPQNTKEKQWSVEKRKLVPG